MLSNNTLGTVSVIMGDQVTGGTNAETATMEAGSLSTKQVFNIKTLQSTTENVPLPSHFTNLGPNVFIAEEGSHAKHDTTSNRHEIASKSNVQTLNNTTKSNTKNPNTFSVKLGDN